jgi:hypothetical protein
VQSQQTMNACPATQFDAVSSQKNVVPLKVSLGAWSTGSTRQRSRPRLSQMPRLSKPHLERASSIAKNEGTVRGGRVCKSILCIATMDLAVQGGKETKKETENRLLNAGGRRFCHGTQTRCRKRAIATLSKTAFATGLHAVLPVRAVMAPFGSLWLPLADGKVHHTCQWTIKLIKLFLPSKVKKRQVGRVLSSQRATAPRARSLLVTDSDCSAEMRR